MSSDPALAKELITAFGVVADLYATCLTIAEDAKHEDVQDSIIKMQVSIVKMQDSILKMQDSIVKMLEAKLAAKFKSDENA